MIKTLRRLIKSSDGTAAVETAVVLPLYLLLTVGVTDLGSGMFTEMTVNAGTQAGAAYAVIHYPNAGTCSSMGGACLTGIQTAMNDATGNASFCTTGTCTAKFTACAEAHGGICFTVSGTYPYNPILPDAVYAWAKSSTYSSTVTVRVPTS